MRVAPSGSSRLAGRVAIITGAAQGIGAGIARRFAAEGAALVLTDRDGTALATLSEELTDIGGLVAAVPCDVRTGADVIVETAMSSHGRLDILINNAGVGGSMPVGEVDPARWDEVISINLTAAFLLTRAALSPMVAAGFGRIVNIASVAGLQGLRASSDYAVSKAGLIALTRSVAADYGRSGITANAIAPGAVESPLSRGLLATKPNWYARAAVEAKPVERMGRPEDIAAAAVYFSSEESGYVSGQTLAVDGGLTAARYIPDRFTNESHA